MKGGLIILKNLFFINTGRHKKMVNCGNCQLPIEQLKGTVAPDFCVFFGMYGQVSTVFKLFL